MTNIDKISRMIKALGGEKKCKPNVFAIHKYIRFAQWLI